MERRFLAIMIGEWQPGRARLPGARRREGGAEEDHRNRRRKAPAGASSDL